MNAPCSPRRTLYQPRVVDPGGGIRAAMIGVIEATDDEVLREVLGALVDFHACHAFHDVDEQDVATVRDSAERLRMAADAVDAIADRMEEP